MASFTPHHGVSMLESSLVDTPVPTMATPYRGLEFSATPGTAYTPRHLVTDAERSPSPAHDVHSGSVDKEFNDRLEQMEITGRTTTVDGERDIINMFLAPLRKQAECMAPTDAYHTTDRVAASQLKENVREEAHTWELLSALLGDSLKTYAGHYAAEEIANRVQTVPQHRWWAVSQKQLLALRLCWDYNFRRALLVLIWLENVYASASSADNKREEYIPSGYRVNTQKLIEGGKGGSLCPSTNRKLVTSIDFDAPRSEQAHIHPADEEAERTLFHVVLQHIRCGHIDVARKLCEEKGYTQCAALLQESCEMLQHIPGVHGPFPPLEVQLPRELVERFGLKDDGHVQLNTTRYSFAAALCDLSEDDTAPGGISQNAVFSALVGLPDIMLIGLSNVPSFRDKLWASLRGYNEHVVHSIIQPFLAGHGDYDQEDAMSILHKTRPATFVLSELAYAASGGCNEPFSQLQSLLIQLFGNKTCANIESFKQLFVFLNDSTSKHAPRLAAHVALQMWRCRHYVLGDIIDQQNHNTIAELLDNIITAYAHHLCDIYSAHPDLLLSTIPYLASKMERRTIELASEFCIMLIVNRDQVESDALCEKLVNRLHEVNVPCAETMTAAHKLLANGPAAVVEAWRCSDVKIPDTTRIDDMIESIRLLTFIPSQSVEALVTFNHNCRLLASSMMMNIERLKETMRGAGEKALDTMGAIDGLQGDVNKCLEGLQKLFDRVNTHVQAQFELQKVREVPSNPSFARLVTERMEAKHWEVFMKTGASLAVWEGEIKRKPVVTKATGVVTNELSRANATALLQQSKTQKEKQAYDEWLLRERRARSMFKEAALQMITRAKDSFWLVDLQCVVDELLPVDRVRAVEWFAERETVLSDIRRKVIPYIAETTLEMFAMHADHLKVSDRLQECQDCVDIVDTLVGDDISDTQSLIDCFADTLQASRITAYCARIDCYETDCRRAMAANPHVPEADLALVLVSQMQS
eukprot:TRINITY_DN19541_c0_g1_i1.p1 TRINITY_DN19541_c0_g1~~TRINITY_DN19541_c0_g1_i1.p1  ORF type:complete len:993 (+),score=276.87 TRINITY_DN19541_c0_g1_i1:36-2981(+)